VIVSLDFRAIFASYQEVVNQKIEMITKITGEFASLGMLDPEVAKAVTSKLDSMKITVQSMDEQSPPTSSDSQFRKRSPISKQSSGISPASKTNKLNTADVSTA